MIIHRCGNKLFTLALCGFGLVSILGCDTRPAPPARAAAPAVEPAEATIAPQPVAVRGPTPIMTKVPAASGEGLGTIRGSAGPGQGAGYGAGSAARSGEKLKADKGGERELEVMMDE